MDLALGDEGAEYCAESGTIVVILAALDRVWVCQETE